MSPTESTKTAPVIRDKEFARRLEMACEGNPNCPTNEHRGKQKWLRDQLLAKHQIKTSPEGVSRWFAGVMRPRPKTISAIAQVLEVDEVWLSLGIKPDMNKQEKKARNAQVSGMVNLVAGMIQMAGGTIAFPDAPSENDADLFAIIKGQQHQIKVTLAKAMGDQVFSFTVPTANAQLSVVGLIDDGQLSYMALRLPADVIKAGGKRKGDYTTVEVKKVGSKFVVGEQSVQRTHFSDFN